MPLITEIRQYDGSSWENYSIGTIAANISVNTTDFSFLPATNNTAQLAFNGIDSKLFDFDGEINNLNTQIGQIATNYAGKPYETYVNDLYSNLTNATTTGDHSLLNVKINGTLPSLYKSKIQSGTTLPQIGSKINYLLNPIVTTKNNRGGNNFIKMDQVATSYSVEGKQQTMLDMEYTAPDGYTVLFALYPLFTGTNGTYMNCTRYWFNRVDNESDNTSANHVYAFVRNVGESRAGGSIYIRILLVYTGG